MRQARSNLGRAGINMNANERRFTPRHKLKIPLTVQPLVGSKTLAQSAESTDVSIRGIYFATDLSLEIGNPVQVLLRMPEEITGTASPKWNCMGRVVRVDHNFDSNGKRGVGVVIHYYDVLNA